MGTWSAEIFGNDTSCEVKEFFFSEYNQGKEPQEICELIKSNFENSLDDEEDKNNVLFALAICLWETKSLTQDLYQTVSHVIETKEDLKVWKSLESTETLLKQREKYLDKLLAKISTEKESAKKRVKPPVPIESDYKAGTCLTFRYPNNNYGGIIIIDSELFQRSGDLRFAFTNINQKKKPDFQIFLNAKLIDFSWETVYGQAQKYAAFGNFTARINTYSAGYERNTKKNFFEYNARFFEVVGKLPIFTQCLLATTGGRDLYIEDYPNFEKFMSEFLLYDFSKEKRQSDSEKTIDELSRMLVR